MVSVLTRGLVLSVGEGERREYRFGMLGWAVGLFWYWAECFPRGLFHIFLFLSSFSFSVFLLLLYLLQKCSKSLKPLLEILQKFTARF
jgi:hypothetical protein